MKRVKIAEKKRAPWSALKAEADQPSAVASFSAEKEIARRARASTFGSDALQSEALWPAEENFREKEWVL